MAGHSYTKHVQQAGAGIGKQPGPPLENILAGLELVVYLGARFAPEGGSNPVVELMGSFVCENSNLATVHLDDVHFGYSLVADCSVKDPMDSDDNFVSTHFAYVSFLYSGMVVDAYFSVADHLENSPVLGLVYVSLEGDPMKPAVESR